ncbi:MAG: ABC transporter ATP-binding protein [Bacilli bacterium]
MNQNLQNPIIEMIGITKIFPGIVANDQIHLDLAKGEIHALLGENGAGKSTLMSVLFGLYIPESGQIKKNGQVIQIKNPNDANHYGIGMVHQHFKLVDVFSVLDNILLGAEPMKGVVVDRQRAKKEILALSEQYKLAIDIDAKIEDISVGMQQRVEILKMLYRKNDILIFDEPTAVLTPQEIEELMKILKNLKAEGKSILFISHKLNEIMAVSDRVTVLRKGKSVGTLKTNETNPRALSNLMVGRDISFEVDKPEVKKSGVGLSIRQLTYISPRTKKAIVNKVSLDVNRGEIVGLAGIEGNGQSELAYLIAGLLKASEGHIYVKDQDVTHYSVRRRNDLGLAHIPEDRHKYGLILDAPLYQNLTLKKYHQDPYQKQGIIQKNKWFELSNHLINRFDVRSGKGIQSLTRSLSGGNQQKAIIAREIDSNADVMLAVQLTRGLDVGAIEYIHSQILTQRNEGKAILMISLELEEIMKLSDRILVMYEGQIVAELNPKTTTKETIGLYMAGGKPS